MEHPLWHVLEHQGRKLWWLAQRTGYSESHLWALKAGKFPCTPDFRQKAAKALDLPEHVLFRPIEQEPVAAAS